MVLFIKMNESHPRDALLHFTAAHSLSAQCASSAQLSPWVAQQDVPGGHLGDVSLQSQCKCFVTLTKLLQHDSVTLSICWAGCNVPSRMASNKSHKKSEGREWREWGSRGQQPQCFPNNIHLNSAIRWRKGGCKGCQRGLSVSCSDIKWFYVFLFCPTPLL